MFCPVVTNSFNLIKVNDLKRKQFGGLRLAFWKLNLLSEKTPLLCFIIFHFWGKCVWGKQKKKVKRKAVRNVKKLLTVWLW